MKNNPSCFLKNQPHFLYQLQSYSVNKIMKNPTLLLALALLLTLAHAQMAFSLNAATYQVNAGYYTLHIPVSGGVPPLTYNFQTYPLTWLQSGESLSIPTAEAISGGVWALKVIVTDSLGNKLRRSLVIKINNGGDPLIGDYAYDQTFTFSSSGVVTSLPTTTSVATQTKQQTTTSGLSGSSGSSSGSSTSSSFNSASSSSITSSSSSSLGSGSLGNLVTSLNTSPSSSSGSSSSSSSGISFGSTSSSAGVISLQAAGTGVNTAIPSSAQLDILINSGDIVSIKLTIQKVIGSTLTCTAKTQYLNDFLGRIQTYIAIKTSQLNQLSSIMANTKNQIASLQAQIANYTGAIGGLGIPSIQIELESILNSLQIAYNAYNAANVDLTPYNLNITANLQSIANLTSQRDSTKQQLTADNKALDDTNSLIASLEQQLAAAKKNKETLSARLLQNTAGLSTLTKNIDILNANNVALNNQINTINNNKATLQANYQTLEARAQGLKSTINAYKAQKDKYQAQIDTLNGQILQMNGNLDITSIVNLNSTIQSLQKSTPSLKEQIDYVKFHCLGVVNYTVQTLNGTISYVFGSSVFTTYVTGQYGNENSQTVQTLLGPVSNVTLTPVTIFNSDWVQAYGSAFQKDLATIDATSKNFPNFFISDFQCSSTAPLSSGSGTVTNIIANIIYARIADGSTAVLMLGACSNVLVTGDSVPTIGNNVLWNGFKLSSNTYQVYSALFI